MNRLWGFLWRIGAVFLVGDLILPLLRRRIEASSEEDKETTMLKKFQEIWKYVFEKKPVKGHASYHVVYDEHKTGKTTLTVNMTRKIGKGVIYVDTSAYIEDFGNSLGEAYLIELLF
ncbi:ATPase family member [Gigaspora margarita]|uniref:ATPase family member n=1 Tax=Gigaspora margarita TaxID=4874 RepID=A0A8H4ATC8_GIGMA|nr:ATPase family member [Gigaspora margarita]